MPRNGQLKLDAAKFEWIKDYAVVNDGGYRLVLFHYPIAVWDRAHFGTVHLYGHLHSGDHHQSGVTQENAYNVGVDVWNYEPVTLSEILG